MNNHSFVIYLLNILTRIKIKYEMDNLKEIFKLCKKYYYLFYLDIQVKDEMKKPKKISNLY